MKLDLAGKDGIERLFAAEQYGPLIV